MEECAERIRLVEVYSRTATEFNASLAALRRPPGERNETDWRDAQTARTDSDRAWLAVEQHVAAHGCLEFRQPSPDANRMDESSDILARAADAALDAILVADDQGRLVEVNQAAAGVLELSRKEIVGRRIDEFLTMARGVPIPQAWASFVSDGVQSGVCEVNIAGRRRRFEYRAKADFAPGLHLSILREVHE